MKTTRGVFDKPKELTDRILVSLKSRNFRLYFGGMCISLVGTWMQQLAMSWMAYKLTGSVLFLAGISFMAQIPILLITPFASVFADRFNRHHILLLTQSLSAVQALLLAWLTFNGTIEIWHLMALSLFLGLINALDNPTRQAFYPGLVAPEHLNNAIALNSTVINGSRLVGPAIGGIVIGFGGEMFCFLLNGLSYLGVIIALLRMHLPIQHSRKTRLTVFTDLNEGFCYVATQLPIRSLLLLMAIVSFFGLPLVTFIPAYVNDILNGESKMLGYLLSCIGLGSLTAAITLAARKTIAGLERLITINTFLLGASLSSLAFIHTPFLAAAILISAGFSIIMTVASINSLLQALAEENKRGRVMGYLAMTFTGISPLGGILLGYLEKYAGLPVIILLSGIICTLAGATFEYYRPLIYKYSRPILLRKGIIK